MPTPRHCHQRQQTLLHILTLLETTCPPAAFTFVAITQWMFSNYAYFTGTLIIFPVSYKKGDIISFTISVYKYKVKVGGES